MAAGMKRVRFRSDDLQGLAPGLVTSFAAKQGESPQDTATRYLSQLFAAKDVPTMSLSDSNPTAAPVLKPEETVNQPLTDTKQVSYAQTLNGVPVHGAQVGVEMASDGSLVGVDGQVADVGDLDTIARIPPKKAAELAAAIATDDQSKRMPKEPPVTVVRYDEQTKKWRLAYVFRGLELKEPPAPPGAKAESGSRPGGPMTRQLYDLFLDAHDGKEIVRVPLIHHAGEDGRGTDASGRTHTFVVEREDGKFVLRDSTRPISTHTMDFESWQQVDVLPGELVSSDTATTFEGAGVSAHAHAIAVLDYLKRVFKRDGLDGRGGPIVSAVDCVEETGVSREWRNAAWVRADSPQYPQVVRVGLMVYGQVARATPPPDEISIAEGLDVVAHELAHGVTDYSGGLEYVTESGALNESYSDIFGVLVANGDRPIAQWNWEIGRILNDGAKPLRSVKDPPSCGQPGHYDDRRKLDPGESPNSWNDNGYVHGNSGIHNKAAYNLFTNGALTPTEVAQLFYLTLTTPGRLSRTATFTDSRDGLVASAETLFRTQPAVQRQAKLKAIRDAFAAVGL